MKKPRIFVPMGGTSVVCHNDIGEVLWSCWLPGGYHLYNDLAQYAPTDHTLLFDEGVTVWGIARRSGASNHGATAYNTGANPDFRPTLATEFEMQTRRLTEQLAAQNETSARIARAAQAAASMSAEEVKRLRAEALAAKAKAKADADDVIETEEEPNDET